MAVSAEALKPTFIQKTRAEKRSLFLEAHNYHQWQLTALAADASFRQYFRLTNGERSLLLMDAPPATEDIDAYVKIDQYLIQAGLRAPIIYALDKEDGFAIIEDFGHDTYTKALDQGAPARPLYELAVQALQRIHSHIDVHKTTLPAYANAFYQEEADLFIDWYWPARTGAKVTASQRNEFRTIWSDLFAQLTPIDQCVVLRDYHVDNLMVIPNTTGLASCGLLDFQDALVGSVAYDMVSLFEDARRDVDQQMASDIIEQYLKERSHISRDDFYDWYAVLGAHRHMKVAGIFVRLCVRDNKAHYLNFMPHVLAMLQRSLDKPQLAPLAEWLTDNHLGNITDELTFDAATLRKTLAID